MISRAEVCFIGLTKPGEAEVRLMMRRGGPAVQNLGLSRGKISRFRSIRIAGWDSRNLRAHLILESSHSCLMVLQPVFECFWTYKTLFPNWPIVQMTLHFRWLLLIFNQYLSVLLPPRVPFRGIHSTLNPFIQHGSGSFRTWFLRSPGCFSLDESFSDPFTVPHIPLLSWLFSSSKNLSVSLFLKCVH